MELDKSVLDSPIFTAFAETSSKRYIYMCNMETGVSRWSKYAVEYFGLPDEYMYNAGAVWLANVHPDDREAYTRELDLIFSGQKMTCELEYRAQNKAGEYVVCSGRGFVIKGENGIPDIFAGTIENHGIIDEVDAVSGLYNIYAFWKYMKDVCEIYDNISVLEVSINNFTDINEKYGYEFGNYLIKKISELFLDRVRHEGFVFRMDGVRFAFVFTDKDEEWITNFYADIQARLIEKNIYYQDKFLTTLSGGAILRLRIQTSILFLRVCHMLFQSPSMNVTDSLCFLIIRHLRVTAGILNFLKHCATVYSMAVRVFTYAISLL